LQATTVQRSSDETTVANRHYRSAVEIILVETIALEKCIEAISSDEVLGAAGEHLPASLAQATFIPRPRSEAGAMEGTQARARLDTYLQKQARQLNGRVLSTAAARTRGDPFAKVKKTIEGMSTKLTEEANEEAGHKTWRESVPGSSGQTGKEKTTTAKTLHADVDALNVATAILTVELAALNGDIARVGPAMGATTPRAEEKAKDTETIENATAAPEAAGEELGALKEFVPTATEG